MSHIFKTRFISLNKNLVDTTGNQIYVNGVLVGSGLYQATGDYALRTELTQTGVTLTNNYTSADLSLSGALSLKLTSTGITLNSRIDGVVTNLTTTGQTLDGRINLVSGNLIQTGVLLGTQLSTLDSRTTVLSGNLITTGVSLGARIDTVTTNLTTTGQILDTRTTAISGNLVQSGINLIAADLLLSGALALKLTATGATLILREDGISGALQAQIGAANGTQVKITGSSTLSTANFTGIGGTVVSTSGSTVFISGASSDNNNSNFSFNPSGTCFFKYPVTGGLDQQFIPFPYSLGSNPRVTATVGNDYNNTLLPFQLSGIVSTGYWLILGNAAPNTGYYIQTFAGSLSTGFAVSVIDNSYNSVVSTFNTGTITVTGSAVQVAPDFSGIGGANVSLSGNKVLIDTSLLVLKTGNSNVVISGNLNVDLVNLGNAVVLPNNPLAIAGSGNTYIQVNLQNKSSGFSAQSDYVLTADIGTDTNFFVDLGINNTNFSDTGYQLYKPLDGFLYNRGGDLFLGTATSGDKVGIHVGGISSGNLVATFESSGIALQSGNGIAFGPTTRLVTQSFAQYRKLAVIESGLASAATIMGPALWSKQITAIMPETTTTQRVWGNTVANAAGTVSTVGDQIFGQYTNFITAAPAGSAAGTSVTTAYHFRGTITGKNGFFFTTQFALSDGTNATNAYGSPSGSRLFIGMTDQTALANVALNDPAGNRVGLSYVWASGGASANRFNNEWQVSSKNNTTEFTGNMGLGFMTGYYRFSMYSPPFNASNTGIYWQLDDLIRGSGVNGMVSNNLPIGSTAMRPAAVIATISGVKNLKINNVYVEVAG